MTEMPGAYWRTLEELAESPDFAAHVQREAPRFADIAANMDRRRFLQLMAASMALAGLTGCGPEPNPRQLLPYVRDPENIIPDKTNAYATAMTQGGYATGVVIAHQMARPFKVEGNPDHPASLGASDALMQASMLELYDPRRAQTIYGPGEAIAPWESFVAALHDRRAGLIANHGAGLRVLTSATGSPLFHEQMDALQRQFPEMAWRQWEPLHRDNELIAATQSFGIAAERIFDLGAAERILGIGSDLLSTAPGALNYSRAFAAKRRPVETDGKMSRVYALESTPTLIGAKADHRLALRPDEIVAALRHLAGLVGAGPSDWSQPGHPHAAWLKAAADDLSQHKGGALVHAGREQPVEAHLLADAINHALGAFGKTVRLIRPIDREDAPKQEGLAALVQEMNAGKVETLLILGANPVYDAPADLGFAEALRRVPFSVCLSLYEDETSKACGWRLPATHEYETWGDASAFDGTISIQQPQIRALYGGHSALDVLDVLLDDPSPDDYTRARNFWQAEASRREMGDFETFWGETVRRGVMTGSAARYLDVAYKDDAVKGLPAPPAARPGELQAVFRPDELVLDGRYAHNPWLLEMPRPFTRLTWDNAALIAPETARRLGVSNEDIVELGVGDKKVKAPVFVLPGQAQDCVTLPLGWGRTAGGLGVGAGFSAYPLRTSAAAWTAPVSSFVKTGKSLKLATTQASDRVEGRDLIRERKLDEFNKPLKEEKPESLYAPFKYPDRAWAMAIDLNSCIGCQACAVACQAENNVPIVGKDEVLAGRAMHWLRIDRYYSGAPDEPAMAFEPMPCMHCEDAPCEVVCPVHATVHDHEGLNLMVYNRCVGTRFCSNNCPYKVRRFNFFAYADKNERPPESWNPEVTVRGRGVMEKCTYCIQRIRTSQIDADREGRPLRDGDVVTACQQACPTQAIVFGDRNDVASAVAKRKASPTDYVLLEDLNTRPRTSYGALIRNPNPAIEAQDEPSFKG